MDTNTIQKRIRSILLCIIISGSTFCMPSYSNMLCNKTTLQNTTGIIVYCTIPFIKPFINLDKIPINQTVILTIKCVQKEARSHINSTTFHQFAPLQRLIITDCNFDDLPNDAFEGLQKLQRLSITCKKCKSNVLQLPLLFSRDLMNLSELQLEGLGIESIPQTLWRTVPNIRTLSVSDNSITELQWLNDLGSYTRELKNLDISLNLLTTLPPNAFEAQPLLTILNLNSNFITSLHEDTFRGLTALKCLYISGCNISMLPPTIFQNSRNLSILNIDKNNITSLPHDVFKGLSKLQELTLSDNKIRFPDSHGTSFRDLGQLQKLQLSKNNISFLSSATFLGLENLLHLDLSFNDLSNVSGCSFFHIVTTVQVLRISNAKLSTLQILRNFSSLTELHAGGNTIREILPESLLQSKFSLTYIYLQETSLNTLVAKNKKWGQNGIFSNFSQLNALYLSTNWIDQFDYFTIPNNLTSLYLDDNRINSVKDEFSVGSTKRIKNIILSKNVFRQFDSHSFTQSIRKIVCNYCSINIIKQGTFGNLHRLTVITFFSSSIPKIERFAFSVTAGKPTVTPRISFNSESCPLADEPIINNLHFAHFPKDKPSLYTCQVTTYCQVGSGKNQYYRQNIRQHVRNKTLASSPVFSEFITLDCGYNNITVFDFIVKKSAQVDTLYLDGNRISILYNNSFTNFTSIKSIFVNNNLITSLESGVFLRLYELQEIHLNNNQIQILHPRQFFKLEQLSSIYLQNNRMSVLDYKILSGVPKLKYINLDHNNFYHLNGLAFTSVKGLLYLTLSNNNMSTIGRNSFIELGHLLTLNLANNSLSSFSARFLTATKQLRKLYLNNNQLRNIREHTFSNSIELQEINLRNNCITELELNTFFPLRHLQLLHLGHNKLKELNGSLFQKSQDLNKLHLDNNNLTAVCQDDFHGALFITNLYLHNNNLKSIDIEAVSFLTNLIELTLHNNQLTHIAVWKLPPSLKSLTLSGNNFPCDCKFLILFRDWIIGSEGSNKVIDIDNVVCKHENGTSSKLSIIQYSQRHCQTHVSVLVILLISGGCFITVIVISVLTYMHRLEMQVWIYSRYGLRLFYKSNSADIGRVYHAFVSYSNDDEEFVAEQLVCILEPEFNLCVHGRDFPVGAYIIDTVCEVVEKSCRTLLVLSNNFNKSEWCRFEFKMAHHQTIKDRCCRLIVILMEDVDVNELDRELKVYLKTNTYLRWGDRFFWEKLKFAMPDVKDLRQQEERQPLLVQ